MSSHNPGLKSAIFALLCAFTITKNGRHLAARIFHKHIKENLFFLLPVKLRCKIVQFIMTRPVFTSRKLMNATTKPWGEQWDYITKVKKGSVEGAWIVSPKEELTGKLAEIEKVAKDADLILFYIHGGGFRIGTSIMYMESFSLIIDYLKKARGLNVKIFSTEYQMAPEVKYQKSRTDCIESYKYLTKQLNIPANKIIFGGDSAGGNLVGSTILKIKDELKDELDLPLGNIMISPWLNMEVHQNIKIYAKKHVDCLVAEMLDNTQFDFFEGYKLTDKDISPLYADYTGFCPTLVTYGGTEVFQYDIKELIEKLKKQNVDTTVITRHNAPHIWLMSSFLSPTHKAYETDLKKVADWCADLLSKHQK